MATLLCSLLVGHGFDGYVVSGYASREVATNNQFRVVCPSIARKLKERQAKRSKEEDEHPKEVRQVSKYKLKDPIDLKSKFLKQLDGEEEERIAEVKAKAAEEEAERIRKEEALPADELENKRVHSWVLMKTKREVFFIEPSTGFRHEITDPSFIGIESLWNHENYLVNRQEEIIGTIANLQWNLLDREKWERLLDVDSDYPENDLQLCPKYLDMPLSWVEKLRVSPKEFEERFPGQQKVIKYKRAIHESFAVYKEIDGVVERIKTYQSLDYQRPLELWEYFENRADLLEERVTDFAKNETMEYFRKGRPDALKSIRRSVGDQSQVHEYGFYDNSRFDCLMRIEKSSMEFKELYRNREDRLKYRRFRFSERLNPMDVQEKLHILESTEEHFERDSKKEALKDVSIRKFLLLEGNIFLQYHYEDFYITATTREFKKPQKPDYGEEIMFDPKLTKSFKSNPDQPDPSNIELYKLLLSQLTAESKVIESFVSRCKELQQLKATREKENRKSLLTFSVFDPLRNFEAKRIRLQRLKVIELREENNLRERADFLEPYLLKHSMEFLELWSQIKKGSMSGEASRKAFDDCLKDFDDQQQTAMADLQRMLEETNEEVEKFKEFIVKFKDHFTSKNIDNITKEGEGLQRFKHVLQRRLAELTTRKESQLEEFKREILKDERLCVEFRKAMEEKEIGGNIL